MLKSGLIVAAGTLALLVASFDTAQAQRHNGGGVRSFSGGGVARGFSSRGFSSRSFAGPRFYAGPRFHAGTAFRAPRFAAGSHIYRHRHHHHRHFRRGVIVGLPLGIYGAYGAYGYSATCDWLYRKAVITGNPYWWSRYEACLYGDY
jgi:hypothetical protein